MWKGSENVDTVNNNAGGDEKLYHLIERLGDKVDALILSMPANYVQKVEYDPWRMQIEGRVLSIESDLKIGREWANNEHKALSNTVLDSERRIMAELKENTKTTKANRLTIALCAIGWIITIALFVISMLFAYHVW